MTNHQTLRQVAQAAVEYNWQAADRLKDEAHELLAKAEHHLREASNWQTFLSELAVGSVAEVIPLPRVEGPHLTLIQGEG